MRETITNNMFDAGRHSRGKLGFVLLATEQTVHEDMITLIPTDVGIHFSRVAIPDSITPETLTDLADGLAPAAALLLPDGSLNAISYACTSGSLVLGEERVAAELNKGAPNAKASCLIVSVINAMKALGVTKVAMATPYLDSINELEKQYLAQHGIEVLNMAGMNLEKDSDMVRVTPDYIHDYAAAVDVPEAQAVFISCGALRSIDIIERLEQTLGKPVITSNQAMAWDMMRLIGVNDQQKGYGYLLENC